MDNQKDLQALIKGKKQRGNKASRKAGRNKAKCDHYRKSRSVRNKLAKLNRHIAKHPDDANAKAALERVYLSYGEVKS